MVTLKHYCLVVIINEVYPAPSQGLEWVELYNDSTEQIVLTGWTLTDLLTSPSVVYTFTSQIIDPFGYVVAQLPIAKLNNSQDGVVIKDDTGEVIDQMSYSSTETDMSWSRINQEFVLTTPTQGESNQQESPPTPSPSSTSTPNPSSSPQPDPLSSPTPQPVVSPSPVPNSQENFNDFIRITDYNPCPSSEENEWVQLYNSDTIVHTLEGWKIRDKANNTRSLNLTIPAQQHAQVSWANSFLNNAEETFSLENHEGEVLQTISYVNCNEDDNQRTAQNNDQSEDDKNQDDSDEVQVSWEETEHRDVNQNVDSDSDAWSKVHPANPASSSAMLELPFPPAPYSLDAIVLRDSSLVFPYQSPTSYFIDPSIPKLPLLSVILGGCLLTITGGYNCYEEYTRRKRIPVTHPPP